MDENRPGFRYLFDDVQRLCRANSRSGHVSIASGGSTLYHPRVPDSHYDHSRLSDHAARQIHPDHDPQHIGSLSRSCCQPPGAIHGNKGTYQHYCAKCTAYSLQFICLRRVCDLVYVSDLSSELPQSVTATVPVPSHHLFNLCDCINVLRPYISDNDILYQLHGTTYRGIPYWIRIGHCCPLCHIPRELEDGSVQGDDWLPDVSVETGETGETSYDYMETATDTLSHNRCLDGMLKTQTAYMESLESIDPAALHQKHLDEEKANPKKAKKDNPNHGPLDTPASTALRVTFLKLIELHTKLNADITPAKREPAIGKLSSKDITLMWKQLRMIFIPVLGLSTSIDILRRHAQHRRWDSLDLTTEEAEARQEQLETLHMMMKTLHEPFEEIKGAIGAGFKHIMIILELTTPPKKKVDDEETHVGKPAAPGTPGFAAFLKEKIDSFHMSKQATLEQWCHKKGIRIPDNFFHESFNVEEHLKDTEEAVPDKLRNQLFFALHMEYMLFRAGEATLDMVLFADKMKQDGKLSHSKFIFPGSRVLYKWVGATLGREDISKNSEYLTDMEDSAMQTLFMGAEFGKRIDPEHLPPRNLGEKIGDKIRKIPDFFRSSSSAFAFRVTCASMSIAIINYLHDTQKFFQEQRLLWSMIMIAISMSRLAGQSTFNFALRVIGTAIVSLGPPWMLSPN
jgi:hypothetical protein